MNVHKMSDHKCSESCLRFNRDATMVCSVTGKCFHQYISSNEFTLDCSAYFTTKAETENKKKTSSKTSRAAKRPKPRFDDAAIQSDIYRLLRLLLYSKKREELNNRHLKRVEKCKQFSNKHHKKRRVVEIIDIDENILKQITETVFAIVKMVNKHRPYLKLKPVMLGTIYQMQHGKSYQTKSGKTFKIERSVYLYKYLPSISDLNSFGLQKNLIRIGGNVIQSVAREL